MAEGSLPPKKMSATNNPLHRLTPTHRMIKNSSWRSVFVRTLPPPTANSLETTSSITSNENNQAHRFQTVISLMKKCLFKRPANAFTLWEKHFTGGHI